MSTPLTLVSHVLCPYVQRAAIVLAEKGIAFERRDIDLAHKPAWFLAISPLGKTPVLQVGDQALFESAVICEYLDETRGQRLHPVDALQRARHRGWMEFGSALLNTIGAFYSAPDEASLQARAQDIRARLRQLDPVLGEGPYFAGERFSLVDAVFGPVFRYFDAFDAIDDFGFFAGLPRLDRWRGSLARRPSVSSAVQPDYPAQLWTFLRARSSALSARMELVA
ncbi:MAG TPA: glutathione S-transferase family protein [Ideonella sp.]|uniref:glutathione S-transferase family protein n=1 Tax=Ideonella sp. TaxID=1929293 RepID=UPI002E304D16|nr:glutathione S-transferase family protein [Ideonella sp.]HEX5682800.1 glutathione S-transferase family protein [Ideonella sp.]